MVSWKRGQDPGISTSMTMHEQKNLITIGLLIGAFKPLVAIKLLNASTLGDMTHILHDELGIQIYRHEPIANVVKRIEEAFEEELREYHEVSKNQKGR